MTVCNSVDSENARLFSIAVEAVEDTIIDSPEWASADDCVAFAIDCLGEEPNISEIDWTELTSPRFQKLIIAYANFVFTQ